MADVHSWIGNNAVELNSVDAGTGFDDLRPLRHWIGDARVIGAGEATHGTSEFFRLKHRLFEFLVSELGFTLFLIEAGFAESLAVNSYVLGGTGDGRHSLRSMPPYCWDCGEFVALIEWMRLWNAQHEGNIFFYGFDMQTSAPPAAFLLDYLARRDPATYGQLQASLEPLTGDVTSFDWLHKTELEKQAARAASGLAVTKLGELCAQARGKSHELEIARLHAVVLDQSVRMLAGDPTDMSRGQKIRDRSMADNVMTLLELHGPESKALVWAHNGHVQLRGCGQHDSGDSETLGQHLRRDLRRDYVALGLAFDHGSFTAIDATGRIRTARTASVEGSLDATLAGAGPPIFALDLRTASDASADWLHEGPPTVSIGGVWQSGLEDWTRVDPRELFDGVLFVRETSPSRHNADALHYPEFLHPEDTPSPEFVNVDFSLSLEGWRVETQPEVGAYEVHTVNEGDASTVLEIFRASSRWPWDVFAISQTVSADAWRGKSIRIQVPASMQAADHRGSAQLAVRVLQARPVPDGPDWPSMIQGQVDRFLWRRVVCRDTCYRDLSLSVAVPDLAVTIGLALVMTGNGRARFGPVAIGDGDR